jgi:acyl-CoA thioesterase
METIRQFIAGDHYAKRSGIDLVSVSPGKAVAKMPVRPYHLNGHGTVQGGAIFTLADFAFAAAANSHGTLAVAINVGITFMKAAGMGTLKAEAREISVNPKLGTYTVDVKDDTGALIAIFQGLVYRKSQTIESVLKPGP